MRKVSLYLLVLFLLSACTAVPQLSETDEVEIYTAVIEQIYTQDDTYGGTFKASDVYILTKTDDSVGDPDIEQMESQKLRGHWHTCQRKLYGWRIKRPCRWTQP